MTIRTKLNPRVVVIGGGTGSFTLLSELKKYTKNLTALVNMADNGGSTGVLRDELGVLPPGDVRQCLVALSNSPELRDLFNFRFDKGTFGGHSFGNLFLSAAEQQAGDFASAVKLSSKILNITGEVVPITLNDCQLVLGAPSGDLTGEFAISEYDMASLGHLPELRLEPEATINLEAKKAIGTADLIIIAPGNLYGSLAPALLVSGVKEAVSQAKAPCVFVCNLVNKAGQTDGFTVHDYVREIERFTAPGVIDYVLYNTDEPDEKLLKKYAVEGEYPVLVNHKELASAGYKAVAGNFLARGELKRDKADKFIKRSLIRHDAGALIEALDGILL